jgi:hypothetical protein
MIDGLPPQRPFSADAGERAYGTDSVEQQQREFNNDVSAVQRALDNAVVIRAVPRVPRAGTRPPSQYQVQRAVRALNVPLRNVRQRFARTHFRLELNPGSRRTRLIMAATAATVGAAAVGIEHAGYAALATAVAVVGDDGSNTFTEAAVKVREGVRAGDIAREQAPAVLAMAAAMPATEMLVEFSRDHHDVMSSMMAGAGFGAAVTISVGISTLLATRTQMHSDEQAREAGVWGELGRLPRDAAFQHDLHTLLRTSNGMSPQAFKAALIQTVGRHAQPGHEREIETFLASNHGVDELVATVRAPSFAQRWRSGVSNAIAAAPARAGALAAFPVAACVLAAVNAVGHGGPLGQAAVQSVFSGAETLLALGTGLTARPVANARYASGTWRERRAVDRHANH